MPPLVTLHPSILLTTNMTILHPAEPRTNGFHKTPASKPLCKEALSVVPISFTEARPGRTPAQLMEKFVQQYNELENYKCVIHD